MDAFEKLVSNVRKTIKTLEDTPEEDLVEYRDALVKIRRCEEIDDMEEGLEELKKYEDLHEKFKKARGDERISYTIWSINQYLEKE